tara:strand:+ start:86 stop:295 length:210 start_codon:yes stop_codon:yes gene_type:complete
MEQVTNLVGNPTTLLIERIFWLGLGGFFCLAIITSIIRGAKKSKQINHISQIELENLAKKAVQQNKKSN